MAFQLLARYRLAPSVSIGCAQTSHTYSHPLLVCQVLQHNGHATGKGSRSHMKLRISCINSAKSQYINKKRLHYFKVYLNLATWIPGASGKLVDVAQPMSIHLSLDQAPDTRLQLLGEVLYLNCELVLPSQSSHHSEAPERRHIQTQSINILEDSNHINHVIS